MAINSAAIRWHDDHLELLDQRRLPAETVWLPVHGSDDAASAIRDMVVRGAPAIGITAAYGLALEAARLGDSASAAWSGGCGESAALRDPMLIIPPPQLHT